MNYFVKSWITTILGLFIMIIDVLYFFGIVQLPKPSFVPTELAVGIAFLAGLVLFLFPHTKLESWAESIFNYFIKPKQ